MSKELKSVIIVFNVIFLLTFALVFLVPYQGDDVWLNYYHHRGLSFALSFFKWSYLHHVSRPSDFLGMLLADDLKLFYSIFAAFLVLLGIIVIFILGTGKIPFLNKANHSDCLILLTIFFALFFFNNSVHLEEAVFILASGIPQLTSILPAFLLIPYFFLLRGTFLLKDSVLINIAFFLWGLISGFTVEYTPPAVAVIIFLSLLISVFVKKRSISMWCIAGLVGLIIGWMFLILAPGPYERAQDNHAFHHTLSIKLSHSFRYTFNGWITYRGLPLLFAVVLFLVAIIKRQKNILIPLLLLLTCWLIDQTFTFGMGRLCKSRILFSGNIFLFAALVSLSEPYLKSIKSKFIYLFFGLLISVFSLKQIYSAYIFHLQMGYRNELIRSAAIRPVTAIDNNYRGIGEIPKHPVIIPAYYHISPAIIRGDGRLCVHFLHLCIFGLPEQSIQFEEAVSFFAKKYNDYNEYLRATPFDKANIVVQGPATVVANARWLPVSIPFHTGYYNVLRGILFIDNFGKKFDHLALCQNQENSLLAKLLTSLDTVFPQQNCYPQFGIKDHPNIIAIPIMRSYLPETFTLTVSSANPS